MFASLKSEFRKLFSLRSTYIVFGFVLLAIAFFAFYVEGLKPSAVVLQQQPHWLNQEIIDAVTPTAVFLSLASLLLITHEYRYNTIAYTLTSSNSRLRTLLAKILAISIYALAATLVVATLAPLAALLGAHVGHHAIVPQFMYYRETIPKVLFYGWGMAMAALLLGALIRNQVGAIVTFFVVPGPVEALMGLLLKQNAKFLPFTALNQVLSRPETQGTNFLGIGRAAMVFGTYLAVGWIIAAILFLKRDAS